MGGSRSSGGRALAISLVGMLVMAGCSVSTPRNGFTSGQRVNSGAGDQSATAGPDSTSDTVAGDTAVTGTGPGGGAATGAATAGGGAGSSTGAAGSGAATGTKTGVTAKPGTGAGTGTAGGSTATTAGGSAAASSAPVVGVTKDTITISAIAGFSGNYGAILSKIYDNGFGTWLDDINAKGGINGRKVISKKVDNRDTVEGGVAACKEVQNNGSYMAVSIVGFGGADVSAVDCLDAAGITSLAMNMSGFRDSWKYVYSAGDARKQTAPLASYIRNVIGDKGKIGIIFTNDPVNGAGRSALVAEMKRLQMNLVHEETVTANQASFVAELTRMRNAGATTVALIVNTNEVLGILRDSKAIGFTPNWTGNYWDTDENTAAARSVFEGIQAIRNYASTNSPAFADYANKARATGRGDLVNSTTMALYGIGLIVGQVLQNAGPNPTRDNVGPAIEALVNYNNQITMTLSFGKGVRVASVGMWPIKCCNGDNTWAGNGEPKTEF